MTTKCYVGTYGKYNNGDLFGKWLDLADYPTYSDFVQACKILHKGEYDPEFMIQDWENLPDGFPAVEWIDEKSFNDLKEAMADEQNADLRIVDYSEKAFAVVGETKAIKDDLKKLGGRFNAKLTCGAGWIFSKSKLNDVQQFLNSGALPKSEPQSAKGEALWEEYKQRILKAENGSQHWLDYWLKDTSDIMMTDCGIILTFEKRKIEVDFCWSDEGADYEEYKRLHSNEELLRDYFLRENLRSYDEQIKEMTTRKDEYNNPLVAVLYERSTYSFGKCGWSETMRMLREYDYQQEANDSRVCVHRMTDNDAQKALAILKSERAKFEKRLHAYLKRYGISKLHTWTYWADR